MTFDESALVLVLPDDTIDSIIAKVRDSGTTSVQILVPDGVAALQDVQSCESLRTASTDNHIDLLLIASDEQTIRAAQQCQLQVVNVTGTRVALPDNVPQSSSDGSGARTAVAAPPAPPPADHRSATTDLSSQDQDFMDDLDDLSDLMNRAAEPAAQPAAQPAHAYAADDYDDFAAALDDISERLGAETPRSGPDIASAQSRPRIRPEDIELTEDEKQQASRTGDAFAADTASRPPRTRIRPEDIELTEDEKQRASATGRGSQSRRTAPARPRTPSRREEQGDEQHEVAPTRFRRLSIIAALVILLLLMLIIGLLALRNSGALSFVSVAQALSPATVIVNPPTSPTEEIPIHNQPIFIAQIGAEASNAAVHADPISAIVAYTVTGQVAGETLAPATLASGVVTLINESQQEFALPPGTEFVGFNDQGQEVRFTSDTPVLVPAATSERTGPGIVISFGLTQVEITARTPGSDSNVGPNALNRIIVPGQGSVALSIEHSAITNGADQVIRVVKDTDVQRLLGDALTGLNSQARDVLSAYANNSGLVLETNTITPGTTDLQSGIGYQTTVVPSVGTSVDPEQPDFSVSVSGNFSALATPPALPLEAQLQVALPNHLANEDRLPFGMQVNIMHWYWSSNQLTVDAVLEPTGEVKELDAQTRALIRDAIKGKSYAEADQALNELKEQQVISSYTLPSERDKIPSVDFLLNLEIGEPVPQSIKG